MNLSILRISEEDEVNWEELLSFGKEEYKRTFGHLYSDEKLRQYLEESYDKALYISWLQAPSKFAVFTAFDGAVLCGYCVCSVGSGLCLPTDQQSRRCGEIKRIYVSATYSGKGVAQQLLNSSLRWLNLMDVDSQDIYLGVYSENHPAIRFYEKNGFREVGRYPYPMIGVEMLLMKLATL